MPQPPSLQSPSQAHFQQSPSYEMGNNLRNINQVESQHIQVPKLKTSAYRHIAGGIAVEGAAIAFAAIGIVSQHKILGPVSASIGVVLAGIGGVLIGRGSERL
ncbi:MAG: hypothetical protein VX185_00895 [Pseudomonadota bacterium]|nr:hypothetical protein [Pseudomonadota bacterium]